MKYIFLFFLIIICGLGYFRYSQPKTWNGYLDMLRATDSTAPVTTSTTDTASSDNSTGAPKPREAPRPTYINPDATNYINPDHVHHVDQPVQQPSTDTPSTQTNTPGTTQSSG